MASPKSRIADKDGIFTDYTTTITVDPTPPTADAGADTSGDEGSSVSFGGSATGTGLSYLWDFGDGQTATTLNASHTYADNGIYTATLTVADILGRTASDFAIVTVANVNPTAIFSGPGSTTVGTAVSFTFSNSNDVSSVDGAAGYRYSYDFNNDGTWEVSNAASASASFTYTAAGIYTVNSRIADKDGGFTDYTTAITVNPSLAAATGNVRVKVVGNRLMITGDNLDNQITVEKGSTPNSYRVTGLAGTRIIGQSGSFVFKNVTRGIDANLKGGDDMLVLDGSASPFTVLGTIKVRTGCGDDLVRLQGVTGKGDLGSSSGKDFVQLIDSVFSALAVDMGNGASTSLLLDDVTVTGRTAVRGGNGADTVRVVDSDLAAVLIQTGRGSDTVRLERVHATGRVQVETGGDTDLAAVSDSRFDAGLVLGGGRGHGSLDAGTLGHQPYPTSFQKHWGIYHTLLCCLLSVFHQGR